MSPRGEEPEGSMPTVEAVMTGDELVDWMIQHGYTDEDGLPAAPRLADAMGVNRTTVRKWIRGDRPIDQRTVLALRGLEH